MLIGYCHLMNLAEIDPIIRTYDVQTTSIDLG